MALATRRPSSMGSEQDEVEHTETGLRALAPTAVLDEGQGQRLHQKTRQGVSLERAYTGMLLLGESQTLGIVPKVKKRPAKGGREAPPFVDEAFF